jgi:hypothetical protein
MLFVRKYSFLVIWVFDLYLSHSTRSERVERTV